MVKKIILDNGIRLVLERIPHFRSTSIGCWFGVGSAYERNDENGLSHFIEHMLFKGTTRRSAKQIAEVMDSVGGQINAFTAKECTCYYCKVMDEHLELGVDLLSDMILESMFDRIEIEKEKGVILEEINMYDDSPEDLAHDLLAEAFFGSHSLALPILGSKDKLLEYKRENLVNFYNQYYTPENMVISIAGNFDEENLLALINQYFGQWKQTGKIIQPSSVQTTNTNILYRHKEIEQIHVCLGFPGVAMGKEEIYPLMIFNNVFGGGMSSRLFQKIREDKGLAYSVFSYPSNYLTGGMFSIYASMKAAQTGEVLQLIIDEINEIKKYGITIDEFIMAREQLKGNYILGMESTNSRMTAIGKGELLLGKIMTPTEVIDNINQVTPQQVTTIINEVFKPNTMAATIVGNEDLSVLLNKLVY